MSDVLLPRSLAVGDGQTALRERRRSSRHVPAGTHAREVRDTMVRAVLVLLFVVLSVTALFYSTVQAISAYSLARNYQAAPGRIVQTQCANRLQVDYAFEANGVVRRGRGMAHKRCDAYRTGEPVAVYFSPDDPANNLNEVAPLQQWHTRLALLLTEAGALVVTGLLFGMRRKA
jgi:hypothetical protein